MKKTVCALVTAMAVFVSCKEAKKTENKAESTIEKTAETEEWVELFNGTDLSGWHTYGDENVRGQWSVEDGAMKFTPPTERGENEAFDIVSDNEYTNFELSIDWKISEAGNSGIFWGVKESEKYNVPYATGPEIQVLDNAKHPDSKNGPKRQAGALYDMIPTKPEAANPAGEWNTCVIKINHNTNKGEVSLNGTQIGDFAVHGPEWDAMVENSKFKGWDGFGVHRTGRISLQDHNDIVWFKNIKIKELK